MKVLRLYRITLQAAMCEVAQGGKLVYYGRAGQQLVARHSACVESVCRRADGLSRRTSARAERAWMRKMRGNIYAKWIGCAAGASMRCSTMIGKIRWPTIWCSTVRGSTPELAALADRRHRQAR